MIKLVELDFQQSQYDRPTMHKICGLVRYGQGCELGPNAGGECPGRAQCIPFRKEDRWQCTRTRASGGKCESGPTPDGRCKHYVQCVPDNNIRFTRRRLVMFSLITLFAVIMVVLASPLSENVISPGPLSNVHAGLDCGSCHKTDFGSPATVLTAALAEDTVHEGNLACRSCHQLGAQADLAHGVATAVLDTGVAREISCSVCHAEHKGATAGLTTISNARCDSCHETSHDPFLGNHPDFEGYLANPISMIAFNHQKHFGQYFLDEKNVSLAPTNCRSCHEVKDDSGKMGVALFREICSDCHDKDVRSLAARQKGIPVFNIPAIDLATLQEKGLDIGSWPEGVEEGTLAPIFAALLARERSLSGLIRQANDGDIDLADLSEATPDDLLRVTQLAWQIKSFLYELETTGHTHLLKQMAPAATGSSARDHELLAGLPLDLVAKATAAWFGDLGGEVKSWRAGDVVPTRGRDVDTGAVAAGRIQQMDLGGWFAEEYQIAIRPSGHADPFLRSWLDLSHELRKSPSHQEFGFAYDMLASRSTPGACVKCHTLQAGTSDQLHWDSASVPDTDFTNFNHKVHFLVVGEEGCLTCHKTGTDSFSPIEKPVCESCHVTRAAGDTCTTCHDYHLGGFRTVLPNTRVEQLITPPT